MTTFLSVLLASVSSSASSSSSSSSNKLSSAALGGVKGGQNCRIGETDETFSIMIRNTEYKAFLESSLNYEVYIDNNNLHWKLLLKINGAETYFTLEATQINFRDLEHQMFEYNTQKYGNELIHCGTIEEKKLSDILDVADQLIVEMGTYNLFNNNCQHFCNNFLHHYRFKTYETTLGKEVTAHVKEPQSDDILEAIHLLYISEGDLSFENERFLLLLSQLYNRYVGAN